MMTRPEPILKPMLSYNPYITNAKLKLLIILLIAAVLRIYISFFSNLPHLHRDTADYLNQADALLKGDYINYFPNGYPLIIAIVKFMAGSFTGTALVWLNILFALATIYFVYQISNQLFKNIALALGTAFLLAVLPTQINIIRWIISEVPTTFFLTGAHLFYLKKKYGFSALFFAMCTFIRTEILLIVIFLILIELIWKKKLNFRFIIFFVCPLLAICAFSNYKTGKFSLAGHGRVNIMYSITASGSNIEWDYIEKHPEIKTKDDAVKKYLDHLKFDPVKYLKQRVANFWELWGLPSPAGGSRSVYSRLLMLSENMFLLLFGLLGLFLNVKRFGVFILIFPFIVVTAVHTIMLAIPRYNIPVEPFMLILACWAALFIHLGLIKKFKYVNQQDK